MRALDIGEPASPGKVYKVTGKLVQGIASDQAKMISKKIRDEGPKGVQAQIQGDQLRVSGKKRDDLQAVIALLKGADLDGRAAVHQLPVRLDPRASRGGLRRHRLPDVGSVPAVLAAAGTGRRAARSWPTGWSGRWS